MENTNLNRTIIVLIEEYSRIRRPFTQAVGAMTFFVQRTEAMPRCPWGAQNWATAMQTIHGQSIRLMIGEYGHGQQ